jgi:DNA-binding NarL/FixJ family response regulator
MQTSGPRDGQFQAFSQHYIGKDPRISATADHPVNLPVTEWTIMSRRRWRSSEMYADFARRFDVPYLLGASLVVNSQERVIFSLNRSRREFSAYEMYVLRHLLPHAARAVRVSQRMAALGSSSAASLDALNHLPFAFIAVDAQGHVVEMTEHAAALTGNGDGLRVERALIGAVRDEETRALRAAIHSASSGDGLGDERSTSIKITRTTSTTPLLAYVIPSGHDALARSAPHASAFVLVFDPSASATEVETARQRYRFSEREMHVLRAIASGACTSEAATELDLSIGQVRATLKRILSKTSARSQRDLVKLFSPVGSLRA